MPVGSSSRTVQVWADRSAAAPARQVRSARYTEEFRLPMTRGSVAQRVSRMPSSLDLGALATEQINPASVDLDARPTLEMLRVFNEEDRKVALAVEAVLPAV